MEGPPNLTFPVFGLIRLSEGSYSPGPGIEAFVGDKSDLILNEI